MPQNIKYAIQTLTYLWGQASLLFAACVEVNFHRDKFKRHITNYSPNATLDKVVVSGLVNYNLIVVCSFLEEWNNEFNSSNIPEFADRINKLKLFTKPILKKISKWSGLKEYRNVVLAHNLRIKGGSSVFDSSNDIEFKVPNSSTEILLINSLVSILMTYLLDEFSDIELELDKSLSDFVRINKTLVNSDEDISKTILEVESLKKNVR